MSGSASTVPVSVAAGLAALALVLYLSKERTPLRKLIATYLDLWGKEIAQSRLPDHVRVIPLVQLACVPLFLLVFWASEEPIVGVVALLVALLPVFILFRHRRKRLELFEKDLDAFLVGLADSLTAVPNLTEALSTLQENLTHPIKEEVRGVLSEVRLGRSIGEALGSLARRLDIPALHAAVGAALLGHRVGGDLPQTLRRIAAATREIARLEGMLKSKTAEGRSQALVMGVLPPGLIAILEHTDPDWLAPMWNDPIGWILLGSAAVLEIAAVAITRKIMAVEI